MSGPDQPQASPLRDCGGFISPDRSAVVLIVEDEPGDAHLIRWQLTEPGACSFVVHLAATLEEATQLIDREDLHPDIVLLDLNLPDSSGVATVERCRRLVSDVPVVVLTGLEDQCAIAAAIECGADDYLAKGTEADTLRRAIRHAILRHLRDTEARLAATVFTHAREAILITGLDGTILDVNDALTRITRYSRDEAVGQNPRILQSGRHPPEFYGTFWDGLLSRGQWHGEIWNRRKDGTLFLALLTVTAVRDARGRTRHYVGLFSDITREKEQQQRLEHLAHYDPLTNLPNRALLADRLHRAMIRAQRQGHRLAVAYLDLDGFKAINDAHGHEAGDRLLVAVSHQVSLALRASDTLARLGGDEFVIVASDLGDPAAVVSLLERLLNAAAAPVQVGDVVLQVSASLGVTFYPQAVPLDADQLLRQADQAMYQAKMAGKNRYHLFDDVQDRAARGLQESLERIARALSADELVLHYQPKVNMRTGQVVGAEALVRWNHPQRGLLPPAEFLPMVEGHPLAVELGEWVMATALNQVEAWRDQGLHLQVSVNVDARHLQQPDFVQRLQDRLNGHPDLERGTLEIEVVETRALNDMPHVCGIMNDCKAIGVSFALDDFGTGYSSLTYLRHLPAEQIKVDQSFVRDMLTDPEDLAIVEGVLGLAATFRRVPIAEGVETAAHGELLLRLGCELGQGYGIARPMPGNQLPAWVASWRPHPSWALLSPVGRDDLQVHFATVEHRAWIQAIEGLVRGNRETPPADDRHDQCRFGQWLSGEGQTHPAFEDIDRLHRLLHDLARELLDLHAHGRDAEARGRLGELTELRDAFLARLQALLQ